MPKIGILTKQLNQLTYSLLLAGYKQCPADWYRGERKQVHHSMWFIAKGSGEITINGTPYRAEPGKLIVYNPGMVCEKRTDTEYPLEFYYIRFSYVQAFEEKDVWHLKEGEDIPFPFQGMYTISNPPSIIYYLEQICKLSRRRGQLVGMQRKILFLELLFAIVQDFRSQKVAGDTTLAIETTIDYMADHYNTSMNLSELANMAGLSSSHYSRLFKKYIGYSPIDYLTHLRIDRAKELLVLSDFRVKEISKSVGYDDELYFSRTFKKIVGVSPSQYSDKYKPMNAKTD